MILLAQITKWYICNIWIHLQLRACYLSNSATVPQLLDYQFQLHANPCSPLPPYHDHQFKVHLTPKYFFRLNKSLHLFEKHCAFLSLFIPNLDFLQAVKVTKSGHHPLHDRASKGYGSIPGLTLQTDLHACLQRLNLMQITLWHPPRNI